MIDSTSSLASPSCLAVIFDGGDRIAGEVGPGARLVADSSPPWGRRTPLPGTAGMKETTNSARFPGGQRRAAVRGPVGPPLLVTWTLGVTGDGPSFFSLTRTSVASRRSQRPTGGLERHRLLALGRRKDDPQRLSPSAATDSCLAPPLASIWVFASIFTPRTEQNAVCRFDADRGGVHRRLLARRAAGHERFDAERLRGVGLVGEQEDVHDFLRASAHSRACGRTEWPKITLTVPGSPGLS